MRATILTLAIATLGGALFTWAGLPLGWLLGAMTATTCVALAGGSLTIRPWLREFMVAVLGIMLGSAFTPDTIGRIGQWLIGMGLLLVYVPVVSVLVYFYLRRVGGFDRASAYFAATPGGMNEMTQVGEAWGGDARAIALVHAVRIAILVTLAPAYFRYIEHLPVTPGPTTSIATANWGQLLPLVLCLAGWWVARGLRLPAAALTGPLILSAAVHLAGLTAARPPPELTAAAQVVIGAALGSRFAGLAFGRMWRLLVLAAGAAVLMFGATIAAATLAEAFSDRGRAALILAFAPGGLAEMSLVALALGIDTAYVATMHVIRIAGIVLLAPLGFRLAKRMARDQSRDAS
jgi:membrane AbrB-like protein